MDSSSLLSEMDRGGDIYFSRDFPVLAAIARWEGAGRQGRALSPETIAEELKRPLGEVVQSVGRLYHAGLVDAADGSTFDGDDYMIRRLTAVGLQESGLWPKAADFSTALEEVLNREIKAASRTDPERSKKLQI